jgi:hypothetical protein
MTGLCQGLMRPAFSNQLTNSHLSVLSNDSSSGLFCFDLLKERQCLRGGVRDRRLLVADPRSPFGEYASGVSFA